MTSTGGGTMILPIRSLQILPALSVLTLLALLFLSCGGDSETILRPESEAAIAVVSGDHQSAMRGDELRDPVVIRVTDSGQNPLSGVRVLFEIRDGEGAVDPPTATTDADGAASTLWTVGLGDNVLRVSVGDSTYEALPADVRATGTCLYRMPPRLGDGWEVASVWDVGLDPALICDVCDSISTEEFQFLNSLLIVKDGKLVLDEYPGLGAWKTQEIASVTKSFTSALVGIAIEKGHLEALDTPVFDFFPEYAHLRDPSKDEILLEHFLTMTAGFEWNENDLPYSDPLNDVNQSWASGDPVEYLFSKPVVDDPGTKWYYNSGTTFVLGAILQRALGADPAQFAQDHLLGPLGITGYEWMYASPGLPLMQCCLQLRSRDLAKFGQLYLQEGSWNGEQLVPEPWVDTSTISHVSEGLYGYLWWIGSIYSQDFYIAVGFGGQRILNVPGLNLVVVHTSDLIEFNEVEDLPARKARYDSIVKMILQAALEQPVDFRETGLDPLSP
jgi:CubicO group peptidase (beta-lactamase class C family)